jgi:hypothetical protein
VVGVAEGVVPRAREMRNRPFSIAGVASILLFEVLEIRD